jgi:hypothetical protein
MRNGRAVYEVIRQKFTPEAVKIAAELSRELICGGVQIMKLLIMHFSPDSCYLLS